MFSWSKPPIPSARIHQTMWRYIEASFAQIQLKRPDVATTPVGIGYTGFPLVVEPAEELHIRSATTPPLSSGVTATVTANPLDIFIDWGDGSSESYLPDAAPDHIYELKTCPAEYRAQHPRGHLCHPTLDEYSIEITYRWSGIAVASWGTLDLGTRTTTTTITRDIDEIIGVLTK